MMQIKKLNGTLHMYVGQDLWRPVPADEASRFEVLHTLERTVKYEAGARAAANEPPVDVRKIRIAPARRPCNGGMVGGIINWR